MSILGKEFFAYAVHNSLSRHQVVQITLSLLTDDRNLWQFREVLCLWRIEANSRIDRNIDSSVAVDHKFRTFGFMFLARRSTDNDPAFRSIHFSTMAPGS